MSELPDKLWVNQDQHISGLFYGADERLKEDIKPMRDVYHHDRIVEALTRKAERLEKALEFYAEKKNWRTDHLGWDAEDVDFTVDFVTADGGEIARQALADSEETR